MLGLSRTAVVKYETGRNGPSSDILRKLSELFGVTTDYLLGIDYTPPITYPIEGVISMPILASVHAGYDGHAIEEVGLGHIEIPASLLRGYPPGQCRVMRVSGSSMYPKMIDGDVVIIHIQKILRAENVQS